MALLLLPDVGGERRHPRMEGSRGHGHTILICQDRCPLGCIGGCIEVLQVLSTPIRRGHWNLFGRMALLSIRRIKAGFA